MHEARHVGHGEEDTHHHQQGAAPAAQRDQGRHEDAGWQEKILYETEKNDVLFIPRAIPMFLMSSIPTMASVSQLM